MSKLCDTLSFCFLYHRLRKILFQMQEWTYMYCIQISGCNVADSIRYVADLFCVLRVFFSYVLCYNVPLLWEYCISDWLYHVMKFFWYCRKKKRRTACHHSKSCFFSTYPYTLESHRIPDHTDCTADPCTSGNTDTDPTQQHNFALEIHSCHMNTLT